MFSKSLCWFLALWLHCHNLPDVLTTWRPQLTESSFLTGAYWRPVNKKKLRCNHLYFLYKLTQIHIVFQHWSSRLIHFSQLLPHSVHLSLFPSPRQSAWKPPGVSCPIFADIIIIIVSFTSKFKSLNSSLNLHLQQFLHHPLHPHVLHLLIFLFFIKTFELCHICLLSFSFLKWLSVHNTQVYRVENQRNV